MYSQSQGVPVTGPVGGDGIVYSQSQGVPVGTGNQYPMPSPSAPVYPQLPMGYGHSGEQAFMVPPPAYQDFNPVAQRVIVPLTPPSLTEEEVRMAVAKHVSGKVFYSSSAVQEMKYAAIEGHMAYVYNLQTFTEMRETKWVYVAHTMGGMIDGPHNGPIPGPWDVVVMPQQEFHTGKTKVPVPHSEHISMCHTCLGAGNTRCHHCAGMGSKACTWCNGSGVRRQFDEARTCTSCSATGRDRCTWCTGHGFSRCSTCSGTGQLKYYIELKVTWNIHSDHVISSNSGLDDKKIIEAPKAKIFEEVGSILTSISPNEFTDQTIVNASNDLVVKHMNKGQHERVIRMKQVISALPITVVSYQRKAKRDSFFVYGEERKVHFESYPSKNCCIS